MHVASWAGLLACVHELCLRLQQKPIQSLEVRKSLQQCKAADMTILKGKGILARGIYWNAEWLL